jgi:hypothetical protein
MRDHPLSVTSAVRRIVQTLPPRDDYPESYARSVEAYLRLVRDLAPALGLADVDDGTEDVFFRRSFAGAIDEVVMCNEERRRILGGVGELLDELRQRRDEVALADDEFNAAFERLSRRLHQECVLPKVPMQFLTLFRSIENAVSVVIAVDRDDTLRAWASVYVRLVLDRHCGNKRQACRALGISYHTLQAHLRRSRGRSGCAVEETGQRLESGSSQG